MSEIAAPFLDPSAVAQLAAAPAPRKALFLDRDGVINLDHGYVHDAANTDFIDGIFDLVRDARALGYLPIVVTNQAGIARGLYSRQTFLEYTRWVHACFTEAGAPLLATFYCPHHPTAGIGDLLRECTCRKPHPGMLLAAADAFDLDLATSRLIGDSPKDLAAAQAAGVRAARRLDPNAAGDATIQTLTQARAWLAETQPPNEGRS
jgi:D-glycero-D-manno-heptose 1,7-bisphosphate phosphatase